MNKLAMIGLVGLLGCASTTRNTPFTMRASFSPYYTTNGLSVEIDMQDTMTSHEAPQVVWDYLKNRAWDAAMLACVDLHAGTEFPTINRIEMQRTGNTFRLIETVNCGK